MELREQVRVAHEAKAEELSRENRGFAGVSAGLAAYLQPHVGESDSREGSMQCSQSISTRLAGRWSSVRRSGEMVGVSERTIRRATAYLEEVLALVRIRVSGSVYAYALTRKRSGARDCQKEQAAFLTRTLVKKNGQNALVRRRLR